MPTRYLLPTLVALALVTLSSTASAAEPAVDFAPPTPADLPLSSADVFVDPARPRPAAAEQTVSGCRRRARLPPVGTTTTSTSPGPR